MALNVTADQTVLQFWVGILLLVSAGSFLYVATIHILPEVFGEGAQSHHHEGQADKNDILSKLPAHFSKSIELLTMMAGLVAPFILMMVKDE